MEQTSGMAGRGFLSDNAAAVHPRVLEALARCNAGHAPAYGMDAYTAAAGRRFSELFEREVETFFVYNGTGANCVALALAAPYGYAEVLCADVSHIHTDECAAPENLAGVKLQPLPTRDGKICPEDVPRALSGLGSPHHAQPMVLSLTQCTEWGTVYSVPETRALCHAAHEAGLVVHMDGARIANAVAATGESIAAMTWGAGVDLLSFGGTKNGLMFGEAVVVFQPEISDRLPFVRKNCGQLASKMRYIAAQYEALLEDELWLQNARHANALARTLGQGLEELGMRAAYPVECNEVFVRLPPEQQKKLERTQAFNVMGDTARFVLSWDSREEDVAGLLRDLREVR